VRVRFALRALADLEAIFEYFDAQVPATTQGLRSAIERAIGGLEDFPYIGPTTDEPGVRVLTLARQSYRIYYEVDAQAEVITILHVRHTSRRPFRSGRR